MRNVLSCVARGFSSWPGCELSRGAVHELRQQTPPKGGVLQGVIDASGAREYSYVVLRYPRLWSWGLGLLIGSFAMQVLA
jgi:hypothetical protein